MMAYQCDNPAMVIAGDEPDTSRVSEDGCKTGLGVGYDLSKYCLDLLFVWGPGSEGEHVPSGFGVEANAPDNYNDRYIMLMVAYKEESYDSGSIDTDYSGMLLYVDTDSSLTPAAKLLVGHHISSKMITLPTENWLVEGICSANCMGYEGLTDISQVQQTR